MIIQDKDFKPKISNIIAMLICFLIIDEIAKNLSIDNAILVSFIGGVMTVWIIISVTSRCEK